MAASCVFVRQGRREDAGNYGNGIVRIDAGGGERSGAEIRGVPAVRDQNGARVVTGDSAYDGMGMLRKIGRSLHVLLISLPAFSSYRLLAHALGVARNIGSQNESENHEQGF